MELLLLVILVLLFVSYGYGVRTGGVSPASTVGLLILTVVVLAVVALVLPHLVTDPAGGP